MKKTSTKRQEPLAISCKEMISLQDIANEIRSITGEFQRNDYVGQYGDQKPRIVTDDPQNRHIED